ncbi:MAG: hypothetical protein NVS4B3_22610 [Gemmatimonadaceae bacterium]
MTAPALEAQTGRAPYDPVTMDPATHDSAHPPSIEELSFTSQGERLNALMYVAQGAGPHPTVILLHGYPGNERNLDLAQTIRRSGINVLYFNYRGAWGSGGTFSFVNAQEDVASAIGYVRSRVVAQRLRADPRRVVLMGHSMGAWLAFLGAAADPTITCVGGIEVGDMARIGGEMMRSHETDSTFSAYTRWLTEAGGPLHASSDTLLASLKANAESWALPHHAPALSDRVILLLDNAHNREHASLVAALRQAGARRLTAAVWATDHSFSDRRIELARTVVHWLHGACGY